jgi:hypothetical protein
MSKGHCWLAFHGTEFMTHIVHGAWCIPLGWRTLTWKGRKGFVFLAPGISATTLGTNDSTASRFEALIHVACECMIIKERNIDPLSPPVPTEDDVLWQFPVLAGDCHEGGATNLGSFQSFHFSPF